MNFSDFLSSGTAESGIEIDGTFSCQGCEEYVESALYDGAQSVLKWTCSSGHVSFIKDFSL